MVLLWGNRIDATPGPWKCAAAINQESNSASVSCESRQSAPGSARSTTTSARSAASSATVKVGLEELERVAQGFSLAAMTLNGCHQRREPVLTGR